MNPVPAPPTSSRLRPTVPSQTPARSVATPPHAQLDEPAALHLGLCTEEAFLHFARDFDFEASLLCFSQDFEHRPVSAAWESVCRARINVPEGFADSAASAIPLRRRLELLLKDGRAGTDPLHWAANNCPEALDVLLSGPEPLINIDAPSQASGTTALMQAASAGKLESVQKLIGHGADPRSTNRTGMTALHAVCFGSANPQITAAILDAAKQKIANSGTPQDNHEEALSRLVNQADQNGDGALKLLFYADSHENSVETAARLLGAGAKLGAYHSTGETALHFGARTFGPQPGEGDDDPRHNNMPLLQFLVSKFQTAGLIDKPDGEGYTALFRAAHVGRTEAVRLLIEAGADWALEVKKGDETHSAPRAAVNSNNQATLVGMLRCVFQQNQHSPEQAIAALEKFRELAGYDYPAFHGLVQLALQPPAGQAAP